MVTCCGRYQSDIPSMSCLCAWILFFINLLAPGIGTIIMGLIACNFCCMLVGIFQLILAPLLIGWIWAICWSVIAIEKSY